MKKYRFLKSIDGRWYIDLPNWDGYKDDLEMVNGADYMLDYLACGDESITLYLSDKPFNGSDEIRLTSMADDIGNGAYYYLKTLNGITVDMNIWLCDVTNFVFGYFPPIIYIKQQIL